MTPPQDIPASPAIRKIPKELRRYKFRPDPAAGPLQRVYDRLRGDPQVLRRTVQAGFVLLCLWIGVEFALFMRWGLSGGVAPYYPRPPGAEAFLPVSGLLGLFHWAYEGTLNRIHPAATVILLAIVAISLMVRKSFCSWICPVGTLADALAGLGRKVFGQNFVLWRWIDYPLRALKYGLLIYFVGMLAAMSAVALGFFVDGAYNRMADVKMYQFFAQISPTALCALLALAVASVLFNRFWCRYLCPYGALLGLAGLLSPLRVTRVKATCVDCELCSRVCPANIAVHRIGERNADAPLGQVRSDECTSCLRCVAECPVQNTLVVRTRHRPWALSAPMLAALVVGGFAAITALGMATGYWDNALSRTDYLQQFRRISVPALPR